LTWLSLVCKPLFCLQEDNTFVLVPTGLCTEWCWLWMCFQVSRFQLLWLCHSFTVIPCGGVNMLKVKCSDSAKLRGFVQEFGEQHFSTDGKILFCKLHEVRVMARKCVYMQEHCDTIKHRNSLNRHFINQNRQWLLFKNVTTPSPSNKTSEFCKDLCEMVVSANIPLHNLNNQQFRNFLEKYMNQYIPTDQHYEKIISLPVMKMF
jgi:hypothetical protein